MYVMLKHDDSGGSFPVKRMSLNGTQEVMDNLQCSNYDSLWNSSSR